MTPSKRNLGGRKSVEKEMSDLGGRRKIRFGLAPRFMVPVTATVSLLIILMGFMAYGSAAKSMEIEIDKAGIFAAKLAASPEIDSWDERYNTLGDLYNRLGAIEAGLELSAGQVTATNADTPKATQEDLQKIQKHDAQQQAFNKRRLRGLIKDTEGALDMLILKGKDPDNPILYAWASNRRREEIKEEANIKQFSVPSSPGTVIRVGLFLAPDGHWVPTRMYQHPICDRKNDVVGFARAIFSVEGLRAGLDRLRGTILIFCALGICVCAATAYVTSKIITRPLDTLLKDIRTVAAGDLGHRTRSRSDDEIGLLAQTFDHMTQNLAAAEEMRVDLADKEHQLQIAQDVQERLFPQNLQAAGSLTLEATNRLAGDLSSDLFDCITLDNGQLGCLLMTASGRGFPAAIILSMARSTFRATAGGFTSPAAALKALNRTLSPDLRKGMYVSAIYAIIDPESGEGRLASAGHRVPALHYRAEKQGIGRITADGIALGLDTGPVFEQALTESSFKLESGDRLVLGTEGACLLTRADGNPLDEQAFCMGILRASKAGMGVDEMLFALVQGLAEDPGDHDLTLVVATRA